MKLHKKIVHLSYCRCPPSIVSYGTWPLPRNNRPVIWVRPQQIPFMTNFECSMDRPQQLLVGPGMVRAHTGTIMKLKFIEIGSRILGAAAGGPTSHLGLGGHHNPPLTSHQFGSSVSSVSANGGSNGERESAEDKKHLAGNFIVNPEALRNDATNLKSHCNSRCWQNSFFFLSFLSGTIRRNF